MFTLCSIWKVEEKKKKKKDSKSKSAKEITSATKDTASLSVEQRVNITTFVFPKPHTCHISPVLDHIYCSLAPQPYSLGNLSQHATAPSAHAFGVSLKCKLHKWGIPVLFQHLPALETQHCGLYSTARLCYAAKAPAMTSNVNVQEDLMARVEFVQCPTSEWKVLAYRQVFS